MTLEPKLKSPGERSLFVLGLLVSAWAWALLAGLTLGVGLLAALGLLLLGALQRAMAVAKVRGNGILVSEAQLPELHQRAQVATQALGLAEAPQVFLVGRGILRSPRRAQVLSSRVLALESELVSLCTDPRQLDFILGRELGHLAGHHLRWRSFLVPFRLVPWLGAAYARACEETADRCGLAVAGDLSESQRALVLLTAAGPLAPGIDLGALQTQSPQRTGFFGTARELISSSPFLSKRLAALQRASADDAPSAGTSPRRSPWAFPLAPLLGLGASRAGTLVLGAALVGVLSIATTVLWSRLVPTALPRVAAWLDLKAGEDDLLVGDDEKEGVAAGDEAETSQDGDASEDTEDDEPPQLDAAPPTKAHGTAPPRHAVEPPSTEL